MTQHPIEQEELQAFLDKELPADRQTEVGKHLESCRECAAMVRDLQQVSTLLQGWEADPAPANLKPPVIPSPTPKARWNWSRWVLGLGATVATVLLVAAISIPNLQRSRIASKSAVNVGGQGVLGGEGKSALLRGPAALADNEQAMGASLASPELQSAGRLIAYQVTLWIEVKEFDPSKARLLQIVEQAGGYVAQANSADTPNRPKSATLTVRVPADRFTPILNQMRGLGRVRQDQLSTEEVTEQVVDLEARLKNARTTEQRLIDVLNNRTGKVGDILQVEQEIARTRESIERMEAQRQNLMRRVEMATVNITLSEEFKAQLETTPIGTGARLWNAMVDGYQGFTETLLGIVLFVARYGLSLAFWLGVVWLGLKLARPRFKKLLSRA